ncbi:unnamed protein product [Alopecurus aequalis]
MALLIPSLLVLLLLGCPADASATSVMAPAPAPATEAKEIMCLGIGTQSQSLASVVIVTAGCLAVDAAIAESGFLVCFMAGCAAEKCFAGPLKAEEEHCTGMPISEDRVRCLGQVAWSCRGSDSDYLYWAAGFIPCFIEATVRCFL